MGVAINGDLCRPLHCSFEAYTVKHLRVMIDNKLTVGNHQIFYFKKTKLENGLLDLKDVFEDV